LHFLLILLIILLSFIDLKQKEKAMAPFNGLFGEVGILVDKKLGEDLSGQVMGIISKKEGGEIVLVDYEGREWVGENIQTFLGYYNDLKGALHKMAEEVKRLKLVRDCLFYHHEIEAEAFWEEQKRLRKMASEEKEREDARSSKRHENYGRGDA
jgi:hypothetical protein